MHKKLFLLILILMPLLVFGQTTFASSKKVLMVLSSYGKDEGKTRPGFEFDEFSQAYLVFKANGLEIDVASPRGGRVEADEFNKTKPYNKAVLEDAKAMALLNETRPTSALKADDYDAVYVVGGKGAMFDLPFDPALQDIILAIYEKKDGIVSAVCHGPAAFVNIRLKDGQFLVAGKAVAGFTNEEEEMFGKRWKPEFPFLLEDKLKARGGVFEKGEMMLSHLSVSGKLITGQNPYSTLAVAEAVVKALGRTPQTRTPYTDEKSMNLVKKALAGELAWAQTELGPNKETYDVQLIAVYGYYRLLGAKDDKKMIRSALDIIELSTPFMYNANLQLERAKGHKKLGNIETAKKLLEELVQKEPKLEEAKNLLNELGK